MKTLLKIYKNLKAFNCMLDDRNFHNKIYEQLAVESIEEYSAYFEEHTKVIKSTTQTTEHLVNGRSETTYRAVAFEKFPVPTTGGTVVVFAQSKSLDKTSRNDSIAARVDCVLHDRYRKHQT
uniref:Uncharacterized protein n=1 Tax=Glossina brevipalpis TaxID=37001 RepID=A0A1A9X400_9MUSC